MRALPFALSLSLCLAASVAAADEPAPVFPDFEF